MTTALSGQVRIIAYVVILMMVLFSFLAPFTARAADCVPKKDKDGDRKLTPKDTAGDACVKGGQPGVCNDKAICTLLGGGPMPKDMGMPPMLPMLPMGGGGGGGMPSTQDQCGTDASGIARESSTSPSTSANCQSSGSSSDTSYFSPSFNTADTPDVSGDVGSGGVDVISSLLNGTLPPDTASDASSATTPAGTVTSNTGVQVQPFGSTDGFTGDARMRADTFTLLFSNRDSSRSKQTSGFFGFSIYSDIKPLMLFQTLCAIRPWSSGYISSILAPTYFDSLCRERALPVGVTFSISASTNAASAGTNSTSNSAGVYSVQPASPPAAPPASVGSAKADIWASPPSISPGSRTSIFWQSTGMSSCSITSSDNNFSGTALSGHAMSPVLVKDATFMISCLSSSAVVSNKVVVSVK